MTFNYKLDENNYFTMCSCGCSQTGCLTYTGDVPEGFPFEVDIRCYKLVTNGDVKSIEYDGERAIELHTEDEINDSKYKYATEEEITDLQSQINEQEDKNGEQDETLSNHGERITILEFNMNGIEHDLKNSSNNLLLGTDLYNEGFLTGNDIQFDYVEKETPPTDLTELGFGYFWYCTKTQGGYTKGKMYFYDVESEEWTLSNQTRKSLNQDHLVYGVELSENDFSKTTFNCGRMVVLSSDGTYTAGIRQGITPITNKFDKLYLSFKTINSLTQGRLHASIDFYDRYDLTKYVRTVNLIPIYRKEFCFTPDESTNLTENIVEIPIQKESELIYGNYDSTAPEDTNKYWINSSNNKLYEHNGAEWTLSNKTNTLKDENNYYLYTINAYNLGELYAPINYEIASYQTMCIRILIDIDRSYVNYVGETAPEPQRNLYWGQESTNKIFRAKYIENTFDSWVEIDTTYTESVENGTQSGINIPFVYPKGSVILSDIKLEYENHTEWCPNEKETKSRNLDISETGISIANGENKIYFDEDEIKMTRNGESTFYVQDDLTYSKKRKTLEDDIDGLITKKISTNKYVRYIN